MCKHLTCWLQRFLLLTVFQHGSLHIQSWFLQLFFLFHSSHKLYLRPHVVQKHTDSHVQLLTNTVDDAQAPPGERTPLRGKKTWSPAFPSSSRWEAWNSVFSPLPRLRPTFFLQNKSNWWENENHKWFNSATKSGKSQTPHQPIMDRAASC